MDRVAVFVDAGYLFAEGSRELCGEKLVRSRITLNHEAAIDALRAFAERISRLPLLRIYWYDGTSQGPSSQHITLAGMGFTKVRLGFVNSMGQQKGVDSLIVTDMITLARNRALAECVLLSGDEDLRVGVQQAQEYGARVHLLGIRPARSSQSQFLRQEADSTHEWATEDLEGFLSGMSDTPGSENNEPLSEPHPSPVRPDKPTNPARRSDPKEILTEVAHRVADEVPHAEIAALVDQILDTGQRPRHLDGKLLAISRRELGHNDLDTGQKSYVRDEFRQALQKRLA